MFIFKSEPRDYKGSRLFGPSEGAWSRISRPWQRKGLRLSKPWEGKKDQDYLDLGGKDEYVDPPRALAWLI
jgi:hypothetical protein